MDLEGIINEIAMKNKEIRLLILTGAGNKAFCTGADLKERRGLNAQEVQRNIRKTREVFVKLENLPQPTIAMINGHAFGGGFELALAFDFASRQIRQRLDLLKQVGQLFLEVAVLNDCPG